MAHTKYRFLLKDWIGSRRHNGPSAYWSLFLPSAPLMILILIATGCDSSSSPTSPSLPSPFSGAWTGITDQGEPISFWVSGNGVELFLEGVELSIQLADEGSVPDFIGLCVSSNNRFNLSVSDGLRHPFDGQRFSFRLPDDLPFAAGSVGAGFLLFDGGLDNSGRATGRLIADIPLPLLPVPCLFRGETTWVANRQ